MVKTIRVSEAFHEWVSGYNRGDETMEEKLCRLTRDPNPEDVAGLPTAEDADAATDAVEAPRSQDVSQ